MGTNPHSSTESDSLIRKFSYPDSQSGNGGVRISEVPLYNTLYDYVNYDSKHATSFSTNHYKLNANCVL